MNLSLPVNQTNALELLPTFDRVSYKSNYGQAAPVVDLTKHIKNWVDDSQRGKDPAALVTYGFWRTGPGDPDVTKAGAPIYSTFTITVAEALATNLLGKENVTFPQWQPASTDAYMQSLFSAAVKSGYGPGLLSTSQQANDLANSVGGTVTEEKGNPGIFNFVYPPDEARRRYQISLPAKGSAQWNVGLLLQAMFVNGVGAPGHWDTGALTLGNFVWIPDTIPDGMDGKTHVAWPTPQRRLTAKESFVPSVGILGTIYTLQESAPMPPAAAGGAGLTDAQATMLQEIHDGVTMLLKK